MTQWIFRPVETDIIECDKKYTLRELRIKAYEAEVSTGGSKKDICKRLLSKQAEDKTRAIVVELERHLAECTSYELIVEVWPDIISLHPSGMVIHEQHRVEISLPASGCPINEALATLAHECGHIGQDTLDEIDAWKRGAYWAKKWDVAKEYFDTIRREIDEFRSEGSYSSAQKYEEMLRSIGG